MIWQTSILREINNSVLQQRQSACSSYKFNSSLHHFENRWESAFFDVKWATLTPVCLWIDDSDTTKEPLFPKSFWEQRKVDEMRVYLQKPPWRWWCCQWSCLKRDHAWLFSPFATASCFFPPEWGAWAHRRCPSETRQNKHAEKGEAKKAYKSMRNGSSFRYNDIHHLGTQVWGQVGCPLP